MALIAMCAFCTEENGKLEYLRHALNSLWNTVDWSRHRLIVINNGMDVPELHHDWFKLIEPGTNLGTAEGINLAIREREPREVVIKCDDDWTTEYVGWVDELEATLAEQPEIGILGLKRDDVYGEFLKDGNLWWGDDIMGTCTAYNPKMLDKVGYLWQPSPTYGFDDVLISARSLATGFKNAFRVDIPIVNLDVRHTDYTEWKKQEAGVYLQEVGKYCEMYGSGKLNIYYDPFEA